MAANLESLVYHLLRQRQKEGLGLGSWRKQGGNCGADGKARPNTIASVLLPFLAIIG